MKTIKDVENLLKKYGFGVHYYKDILFGQNPDNIPENIFKDIQFLAEVDSTCKGRKRGREYTPGDSYYKPRLDRFFAEFLERFDYYYDNIPLDNYESPMEYYHEILTCIKERVQEGYYYPIWHNCNVYVKSEDEIVIQFDSTLYKDSENYYVIYAAKFRVSEHLIRNKKLDFCSGGWFNQCQNMMSFIQDNMDTMWYSYFLKDKDYYISREYPFSTTPSKYERRYYDSKFNTFFRYIFYSTECYRFMTYDERKKTIEYIKSRIIDISRFDIPRDYFDKILKGYKEYVEIEGEEIGFPSYYATRLGTLDFSIFEDLFCKEQ